MVSMEARSRALSLFLTLILLFSLIITGFLVFPLSQTTCTPLGEQAGLRTVQGRLVDGDCHEVHLTGVNWFGMETPAFAPHGLDVRNWQDMLDQIVRAGFNTIRLPFSNQFLDEDSLPQGIDYQKNPDLKGLHGLSLLDRLVEGASQRGLKVILDRHRPTAYAQSDLWYTSEVPESRWIADWVMLARHFLGNPTVIGADLHNEPHGAATWGSGDPKTDWRLAAERAGNAILSVNPAWLIIVQGVERYHGDNYWWGGNLEGAGQFPVRLLEPGKLVYSIHDYGPEVSYQPWFYARDFPENLPDVWMKYWGYLQVGGVAPVLVGEFGAISVNGTSAGVWMRSLVAFMRHYGFSYTYWAWNPDTWDTGGLLMDDWRTLDPTKMSSLATYQCPLLGAAQPPFQLGVPDGLRCSGIP
jgi:endoglucanase